MLTITTHTTIADLITLIPNNSLTALMAAVKGNASLAGDLYETIISIIMRYNCFNDKSIKAYYDSIKAYNLNKETDFFTWDTTTVGKCGSKGSGVSDHTFSIGKTTYFTSTKSGLSKNIMKKTDIESLNSERYGCPTPDNIHLILITNLKSDKGIQNKYNKKNIKNLKLYNISHVSQWYKKLQNKIKNNHTLKHNKQNLTLFFHQKHIVADTVNLINQNKQEVLWGCVCRSGKSYLMAGLIHAMRQTMSKFLIITPIPTETLDALVSMFSRYHEFDEFDIITTKKKDLKLNTKKIYIFSIQSSGENRVAEKTLKQLRPDILFYDEQHYVRPRF